MSVVVDFWISVLSCLILKFVLFSALNRIFEPGNISQKRIWLNVFIVYSSKNIYLSVFGQSTFLLNLLVMRMCQLTQVPFGGFSFFSFWLLLIHNFPLILRFLSS